VAFWRRPKVKGSDDGVSRAQAERVASERRLHEAEKHVMGPLRRMREENHVTEMLGRLIEERRRT
jgi:hypothetical protein